MSPAVIKKEHDYLGLFEYNMNHEAEIMRALIYGKLQSFIYSKPFPRFFWNTRIMISMGMVSKGQYSNFGPREDSQYSIFEKLRVKKTN